jgi:hypothetical protein
MTLILLTGAGFSRNWGGWLASEAFEYLLGREEVGGDLRRRLWKDKIKGKGFEDTLADLQHSFKSYQREADRAELNGFRAALSAMFAEMNESFSRTQFEFTNDVNLSISKLLSTFDFIFTLNQDLLLEHHYVGQDNLFGTGITRCEVPGLTLANPAPHGYSHDAKVAKRKPIDGGFRVEPSIQPYFKLHGSSNWLKANGDSLLRDGPAMPLSRRGQYQYRGIAFISECSTETLKSYFATKSATTSLNQSEASGLTKTCFTSALRST